MFIVLAGCATPPPAPPSPPAVAPPEFTSRYEEALSRGEAVYRVETERSAAVVRVYRGGPLARFGHDHVVTARALRGYMSVADGKRVRADLYQPLAALHVDEAAVRAQAGFDSQLSSADIAATRRNMLEKVLEAERYPFAYLQVDSRDADAPGTTSRVVLTLHGAARELPITFETVRIDAERVTARGRFALRQTDFGVVPFTALGGALQVQDQLDVEFVLHAVRVVSGAPLAPS